MSKACMLCHRNSLACVGLSFDQPWLAGKDVMFLFLCSSLLNVHRKCSKYHPRKAQQKLLPSTDLCPCKLLSTINVALESSLLQ